MQRGHACLASMQVPGTSRITIPKPRWRQVGHDGTPKARVPEMNSLLALCGTMPSHARARCGVQHCRSEP
eukprot:2989074-Lingulodinium_polyedra.AAC.1